MKKFSFVFTFIVFLISCGALNLELHKKISSSTTVGVNDSCNDPTTPVGTVCSTGTIYAGAFDYDGVGSAAEARYMIMPLGCDGGVTNPTCVGANDSTISLAWLDLTSGGTFEDIAAVNDVATGDDSDTQDGRILTAALVSYNSGGAVHAAAKYCADMVYGGYSDWYLPTKSELAYLYCVSANGNPVSNAVSCVTPSAALSGKFSPIFYYSSSEYDANASWMVNFSNGEANNYSKSDLQSVRCVRRM